LHDAFDKFVCHVKIPPYWILEAGYRKLVASF
jgi:hypothetical protein